MERTQAYDHLRGQHQASEERFRDLFDEATIAYVHEGMNTEFMRANHTAMRILGIKPEEMDGIYGMTFIPNSPKRNGG